MDSFDTDARALKLSLVGAGLLSSFIVVPMSSFLVVLIVIAVIAYALWRRRK